MRLNKRVGMETIIVSFTFLLLLVVWKVVQGMFLTLQHVPQGTPLQTSGGTSQVDFGHVASGSGLMITLSVGGIFLLAIAYYVVRSYVVGKNKR
ncbi:MULTISPECIES: hypothetical protein [Paenibacillus]|uniref:Uncharacterized protein n=1 Tax=Paenibacillus cucumis (ex Kampfer et al. 2016) TaxID=1776858 RepID=A0ABS7KDS0_9BACL|nr:hypothetical protein [Paenibacillus cucumis (ex Kampfer et al. 2016)]MBY0202298.1 hypothetical protein [Paenibacillus cucumis (ex Kampfer et al. 2016)]